MNTWGCKNIKVYCFNCYNYFAYRSRDATFHNYVTLDFSKMKHLIDKKLSGVFCNNVYKPGFLIGFP